MRPLLLLFALTAVLSAEPKRLELGFPNLADRLQIVFPENYDQSRKWPAVFYYHGTNGKPSTELIRAHTGDQGFFVVGMTYVQQGAFTYTKENLEQEWRILHATRNHLATKWNLDPKRVYVAGFSKGGWMSGFLLQKDPTLAGAIMLGGGHIYSINQSPRKFRGRKPLFVGVGREDGNYHFSLRALTFYKPLGAQTTFETWHGLGHNFPREGSPALKQWLSIEANPAANHQAAAGQWATERIDEIKALPNPVDQWVALRDMQEMPYLRALGDSGKTRVKNEIARLEKIGRVAAEAKALAAHRDLLRKEMGPRTDALWQGLLTAYLKLAESHPGTRQAGIAMVDHERVKRLIQHNREQDRIKKERTEADPFPPDQPAKDPFVPGGPTPAPVIPRNPLVR